MSRLYIEDIVNDRSQSGNIRFHEVDWNSKNIPISKDKIDWLSPYDIDDFPLVQFHVSKSLGRVVGFFDEDQIFNVVLLDNLHNLQPSKTYNYRVRASHPAQCEITKLSVTFNNIIGASKEIPEGEKSRILREVRVINRDYFGAAVLMNISDAHLEKAYNYVAQGAVMSLDELLEYAIDTLS